MPFNGEYWTVTMSFKNWLIEIGKSQRTANSYDSAISGVISQWSQQSNISDRNLIDIVDYQSLQSIASKLEAVDIYRERNLRGKNMYSCALKSYLEYRKRESPDEVEQDISEILVNKDIPATEKPTYISARVGQGRYRSDLIGFWERCALTGYSDVRLLVASHIKPWKKSDNTERLDPFNGLLLLPNLDKVFDLGFITFNEDGKIKVSRHLEEASRLGISADMHINLAEPHLKYINHHRNIEFERFVK